MLYIYITCYIYIYIRILHRVSDVVNLSCKLISMEILPPASLQKPLSLKTGRKRKLKVTFNVPDADEEELDKTCKKRRKSPSPLREPQKRKKLEVKRSRFHPGVSKSVKAGAVPRKMTKPTSSCQQPAIKVTVKREETTVRTIDPLACDKNDNCSETNLKKNSKVVMVTKKQSSLLQKGIKKTVSKSLLKQSRRKSKLKVRSKRSGLRGNVKRLTEKGRKHKTHNRRTKKAKYRPREHLDQKAKKKMSTQVRRIGKTTAKRNISNAKQRKSVIAIVVKSKVVRSALLHRKFAQHVKRATLELKRKQREKKRKEEQRQLTLEIEMERDKFERQRRRKIRIIPIKRDDNYEILPGLRISFLKFITFKEAFARRLDCCDKCCWDTWPEVDADDLDDDYN